MNVQFLVFLFCISTLVSYILLMGIHWLWRKLGILDRPHLYPSERGRKPAPYSVWIVIYLTLLLLSPLLYIFWDISPLLEKRLSIVLIIGWLLNIISFVDDMDTIWKSPIKVPPIFRLLMQICIGAVIGITSIKIAYVSNIFGGIFSLDDIFWQLQIGTMSINVFPMIVTILWYVLIFNAVNFSDGIPGVTGWFACISFLILAILALKLYLTDTSLASRENSIFILLLLAILIPATFFLTKADISRKVIMGDTGTLTLAFFIATLAIIAWWKIATTVSVLGVYIIDAIYVILLRLSRGQNPLKWDQDSHLHYRLMEIGLSKSQVRLIIYFLTAVFGLSAIFLNTEGKIILFVIIAGITIFLTEILQKVKKK